MRAKQEYSGSSPSCGGRAGRRRVALNESLFYTDVSRGLGSPGENDHRQGVTGARKLQLRIPMMVMGDSDRIVMGVSDT